MLRDRPALLIGRTPRHKAAAVLTKSKSSHEYWRGSTSRWTNRQL